MGIFLLKTTYQTRSRTLFGRVRCANWVLISLLMLSLVSCVVSLYNFIAERSQLPLNGLDIDLSLRFRIYIKHRSVGTSMDVGLSRIRHPLQMSLNRSPCAKILSGSVSNLLPNLTSCTTTMSNVASTMTFFGPEKHNRKQSSALRKMMQPK